MTWNSILKLKGKPENIIISYEAGMAINKIYTNDSFPNDYKITIQKPLKSFSKGAIALLEINKDGGSGEVNNKLASEFYKEESDRWAKLSSRTIEQKANSTEIFEQMYLMSIGKKATNEDIKKAYEIQKEFFMNNQKRNLCDPILFKKIILIRSNRLNIWENGMFRIIERMVTRDIILSEKK